MVQTVVVKRVRDIPFLFELVLLTLLIQTVVVSNIVKGLVVPYCLIILLFLVDSLLISKRSAAIWKFFIVAVVTLSSVLILQQATNLLLYDFSLDIDEKRIISGEGKDELLFRWSSLTQSAYFLVCLLYFGYSLYFIKHNGYLAIITLAKVGLVVYVSYGVFVYLSSFLSQSNMDFISNRITGDGNQFGGNIQWLEVSGNLVPRFVSLSGEPSMFAFAVVPFMIFSYYMRENILCLFLAICLALSTSTTAIAGIIAFIAIDMLLYRKSLNFVVVSVLLLLLVSAIKVDLLFFSYEFIADKLNLVHVSGVDRYDSFTDSIMLFGKMDYINQLVGIGFGYVRSTDGLSTILVNNGVLGLVAILVVYGIPVFKIRAYSSDRIKALKVSNLVILFMMLISVTEFYNFQVYFFLSLLWAEYLYGANTRRRYDFARC